MSKAHITTLAAKALKLTSKEVEKERKKRKVKYESRFNSWNSMG